MKKYKEYMDRIRVDEAQHGRFLKALQEAEKTGAAPAGQEAGKHRSVRLSKIRLLRYGGIAAAAVLAVVLIFGPGLGRLQSSPEAAKHGVTTAPAAEVTAQKRFGDDMAEPTFKPEEHHAYADASTLPAPPASDEKETTGAREPLSEDVKNAPPVPDTFIEYASALPLALLLRDGSEETTVPLSEEEAAELAGWIRSGLLQIVEAPGTDAQTFTNGEEAEGSALYTGTLADKELMICVTAAEDGGGRSVWRLTTKLEGEDLAVLQKILSAHGLALADFPLAE